MSEEKRIPDTMRQVLEELEDRMQGRRVFRYMAEQESESPEDGWNSMQIKEISGEQFFRDIKGTADLIRRNGLAGTHIGIMGANSYGWIMALCAIFWSGSVAVLLDHETDPADLRDRAQQVSLAGMICDSEASETVRAAGLSGQIRSLEIRELLIESREMRDSETDCAAAAEKRAEDLACIFFTSGTTGGSKAVMMSEHGLAAGICHRIQNRKFRAILAVLPFHHISGFSSALNALYLGAEVCLAEQQKYFYKYLETMKPDYVFVVPSMLRMLARKLKNGGPSGRLLGWDLHMINCGGAAFCPEFLQMLLDRNITVMQGYGASEAGAIGLLWEMTTDHPDTIGKPPAGLEIKIVDDELWMKSEAVMMGYYGDEEGTRKVLRDGWYITGDLCRMDADGYLYLTGRKKNLIILSNGENISPEEIEGRLYQYEEIREAVVQAEGDLLTASIYPAYPRDCPAEEQERIREKIRREAEEYNHSVPVYRQIRKVHFLEEPVGKTASGKLIRRSVPGGERQ